MDVGKVEWADVTGANEWAETELAVSQPVPFIAQSEQHVNNITKTVEQKGPEHGRQALCTFVAVSPIHWSVSRSLFFSPTERQSRHINAHFLIGSDCGHLSAIRPNRPSRPGAPYSPYRPDADPSTMRDWLIDIEGILIILPVTILYVKTCYLF